MHRSVVNMRRKQREHPEELNIDGGSATSRAFKCEGTLARGWLKPIT